MLGEKYVGDRILTSRLKRLADAGLQGVKRT